MEQEGIILDENQVAALEKAKEEKQAHGEIEYDLKLMRMLTDRGTEYCENRENHEYELYLAVEDIDHSKIKAKNPQTNGICERFNRTVQNEFYAIASRKEIYATIEQLQNDLDTWMNSYNTERTHSGKYCFRKRPCRLL